MSRSFRASLSAFAAIATLAAGGAVVVPSVAAAAVPYTTIDSATGPLASIDLANELSCQVFRTDASGGQVYPDDGRPGDCGTFLKVDGASTYVPDWGAHSDTAAGAGATPFTPVSQTGVTGGGTVADPFSVTTDVTAGSDFTVSETDSYVEGQDFYTASITVKNVGGSAQTIEFGRAMDCYLMGDDSGFGFRNTVSGMIGCSGGAAAADWASAQVQGFQPMSSPGGSGLHYMVGGYGEVWAAVHNGSQLPDTIMADEAGDRYDNGAALSWRGPIAAGESRTFVLRHRFSALNPLTNVTVPAIAVDGGTYTSDRGTWLEADDDGYSVQWQRCASADDLSTCVDIDGATDYTYTPVGADVGNYLRSVVRASQGVESLTAASAPSFVEPPADTTTTTTTTTPDHVPTTPAPIEASPDPATSPQRVCVSRRTVTLNWIVDRSVVRRHGKVTSLTVTIKGKTRRLKVSTRSATVDMRGMQKTTVPVKVVATLRSGKKISATRTYKTCSVERDSHPNTLRLR